MNFDWIDDYKKSSGWSDNRFYEYGLTDNETLYAWLLTGLHGKKLEWVKEKMSDSYVTDFGVEETWVYVNGDTIKFTDNDSDKEYICTLGKFLKDLELIQEKGL